MKAGDFCFALDQIAFGVGRNTATAIKFAEHNRSVTVAQRISGAELDKIALATTGIARP